MKSIISPSRLLCVFVTCMVALATVASAATGSQPRTDPPAPAIFTNRLINSNDPYLLLHAHNPVDWYPWGSEALERAKRENKPIFVSIGYSTCYWCHIAEREIYSNPAIAKLMNEWFINIKVDREQRPDLDGVYMDARLLLTGSGGWPNNLFLTPDLKPFYAGSYYPATDQPGGQPGFPTVLRSMHDAWLNQRQDVLDQSQRVFDAMRERNEQPPSSSTPAFDVAAAMNRSVTAVLDDVDWTHGGTGPGSKYPQEPTLSLLLSDYRSRHNPKELEALTIWLDAMALGGIRDQLDGGFHRYSVESTWSVPHFEKMLYDNAQLLGVYAEAYQTTHSALYAHVANELSDYLAKQLGTPRGGFYAAQDAEVSGHEGASYLWTRAQIEAVLGPARASDFLGLYALTPLPVLAGSAEASRIDGAVLRVQLPAPADLILALDRQAPAREQLLAARARRPQPARDEKIIVAWNAMAIGSLARSAEILDRPANLDLARRTAQRLWKEAYNPEARDLKHQIFRDRAQGEGYLDDYALLGVAFLDLADSTHETRWRDRAKQLAAALVKNFYRNGSLVTTVAASGLLIVPRDTGDDTMPSGTSATVELLSRLRADTAVDPYPGLVPNILSSLEGALSRHPERWADMLVALSRYSTPTAVIDPALMLGSADHVKAHGELIRGNDHDEIVVSVAVEAGYHINANPASFDYLIATQLSIAGHADLTVNYPAPSVIRPKFALDGLKVYEGLVTLRASMPRNIIGQDIQALGGDLRIQACNEDICLPPGTINVPIEFKQSSFP
jgi:uncharacterized protein